MRLLPACLLALGVLAVTSGALAESAASSGQVSSGSTLTRLAQKVGSLPLGRPSLVAVTPTLAADLGKQELTELTERIRAVVAAAVPGARVRLSQALSAAQARQRARELDLSLVLLSPGLRAGELHLDVDVIEWPTPFWARVLSPEGTVTNHWALREPADAEVRRHLPHPKGLLGSVLKVPAPLPGSLALACGDVGPDGGQALVLVGRRDIEIGRLDDGRWSRLARTSWDILSPLSPHPQREPVASVALVSGRLRVGSSDRAYAVELDRSLNPVAYAPQALPLASGECLEISQTGFSEVPGSCGFGPSRPVFSAIAPPGSGLELFYQTTLTTAQGTSLSLVLKAPIGSPPELWVVQPAADLLQIPLPEVGSQVAIADLDGDFVPELISSKRVRPPTEDALLIQRLEAGKLSLAAELPAGPISALTVCPFFGRNPQTLVAAVGDELWLIS